MTIKLPIYEDYRLEARVAWGNRSNTIWRLGVQHQKEIREYWRDKLKTVDPQSIISTGLPESTREFLTLIGLPIDDQLDTQIKLGIKFTPDDIKKTFINGDAYLKIGFLNLQESIEIGIGLKETTGEVFNLARTPYLPSTKFANSNIVLYLLCLIRYSKHHFMIAKSTNRLAQLIQTRPLSRQLKGEYHQTRRKYESLIARLKVELAQIDPQAFDKDEYYWTQILFDLSI